MDRLLNTNVLVCFAVFLLAIFPLTDTDIWWHLACGREWVNTWTPSRTPVVNVHEFFQSVVSFAYGLGGAPFLVFLKALLWSLVFGLFLGKVPSRGKLLPLVLSIVFLFAFRYQFEIRPVVFSLVFLGLYWNLLPNFFGELQNLRRKVVSAIFLLIVQWIWCRFQGLFILGPFFAFLVMAVYWNKLQVRKAAAVLFLFALYVMPFLHEEGLRLFLYPFGLLDRLLGLSKSTTVFASEIAENRSPLTLLAAGENQLVSILMVLLVSTPLLFFVKRKSCKDPRDFIRLITLLVTGIMALSAERNFVLFLPVLVGSAFACPICWPRINVAASVAVLCFVSGLWCKSLASYDFTMISYQRVPVDAAVWMKENPHLGRLFNDDRAGGYLAFVNPDDPTFIDGRFILKTADFFERYLSYASDTERFLMDAESFGIDRAVFPLKYYARWEKLIETLSKDPLWQLAYKDDFFCVFQR